MAGNNVELGAGDFEKIDDGWRVSKEINSSAIQSISPNNPWYFETKDRAGNVRRTSGSISGTTAGPTAVNGIVTINDGKYDGALNENSFAESSVRVTRNDANGNPVLSNAQPIAEFSNVEGEFTFLNTAADPLFGLPARAADANAEPPITERIYLCPFDPRDSDPYEAPMGTPGDDDYELNDGAEDSNAGESGQLAACGAPKGSKYEILGSNLITVDSEEPELDSTETGIGYNSGTKKDKVQKNSIKLTFSDLGSDESGAPGSGLDAASVTPAAFTVGGNTVESVTVAGNKVYLTLADNLGSTEQPSVNINSGVVMDKAGNAFGGERVGKAADKLGPNLSLSKSADLSNDKVIVTITTDEQLNASPTVTVNKATTSDGEVDSNGAVPSSDVRQAGSLSFTYTHSNSTGGEFSVHASGEDTGENDSSVGDKESASSSKAFTFELDKRLNNEMAPAVMVADKTPVDAMGVSTTKLEEVEVTSPLNITVDFSQEGKEYPRDSYKTITLTKATLKVTADDGTSETTTFDIATDVNSPDSVKFTISVLNPAVGAYQLTVQAMDEAGNVRTDGTGTTAENLVSKWKVIPARPFSIDLAVGWNQISMPFHPANPAINSVIAIDHPITTVLTYDNIEKVWLFSTRNAETGLFEGDVSVMTADTAYFVLTTNFTPLKLLRPPLTSGLAGPPVPLAITVLEGWNLVPVITNSTPSPVGIAADAYFGSLGTGATAGWLRALTFNPTSQGWDSVTPGGTLTLKPGDTNPCTGKELDVDKVLDGTEPCQVGEYTDRSRAVNDIEVGDEVDGEVVDRSLLRRRRQGWRIRRQRQGRHPGAGHRGQGLLDLRDGGGRRDHPALDLSKLTQAKQGPLHTEGALFFARDVRLTWAPLEGDNVGCLGDRAALWRLRSAHRFCVRPLRASRYRRGPCHSHSAPPALPSHPCLPLPPPWWPFWRPVRRPRRRVRRLSP